MASKDFKFSGAYGGEKDKKKEKSTLEKMAEMTRKAKKKNSGTSKLLASIKKT